MCVHAGVEVRVNLVAAVGIVEEFAAFHFHPLPIKVGELLPLGPAAGAVLTRAVGIHFYRHYPQAVRSILGVFDYLASQLVG